MLLSVLTRNGQGPKAQLSPAEVQVLAKRRGSLQGPVTLPRSVHPAPRLGPPASAQAWLKRQISAGGSLRARSPEPAQPSSPREPGAQDPTGPQAPQAAQTAGARSCRLRPRQMASAIRSQRPGELEGPREKAEIRLLPHSPPDDHRSADHWLNSPLMAAH